MKKGANRIARFGPESILLLRNKVGHPYQTHLSGNPRKNPSNTTENTGASFKLPLRAKGVLQVFEILWYSEGWS
jgi:hypothetical protein